MVGLTDIAPSTRTVTVGQVAVPVYGVSVLGVAALLTTYPVLKELFKGNKFDATPETIIEVAPGAVAAIIAAGCGGAADPKQVEIASRLPIGKQLEFLSVIVEETIPDGAGPFVEALNAIMTKLNFEDRGKAPDSNSPLPSKP